MRVFKPSRLVSALFILSGIMITNVLVAQTSDNHKANIIADEFTAKGTNQGWTPGSQVPNLQFNDVFTKKFNLHEMSGKPVIIEIYDPEAIHTTKHKNYLKNFYKQYDVNIISIAETDYPNQVRAAIKNESLSWPHVVDDSRKFTGQSFAQNHKLEGVNFVFVSGNRQVKTIVKEGEPIGKLGAALQQYFASN